jgi:hypothetical protein
MKRIILSITLVLAGWSISAQQTAFVNTIQDFRSRVIDFREDGLTGCFREGVLINPSPADLEVGDIFIDVDGNAKLVSKIEKVGKDIYIDTVKPRLEDVFLYAEIPFQIIVFNEGNFRRDTLAGTVNRSSDSKGTFNVSFEKEIYSKPPSVVKIAAEAELSSSIGIGFAAPYYTLTSWQWWKASSWRQNQGYIQGSLDYNLALTGSITIALEGSKESTPVLLYGFGTPTTGIAANLGLFTKTILEGSLSLTLPLTFAVSGNAGAKCTLAGMVPVIWPTDLTRWGSIDYSVGISPELTAEAALRQKFYLGADVTIVGIKITEFEAGGGPYIKVNGTVGGSLGYSPAEGLTADLNADATGEIGISMDITGKVYDGKWTVTILSYELPLVTLSASEGWSSPFLKAVKYPESAP